MKQILAILLAGMFGTLCRYGVTQLPWPRGYSYGTLAVNLLGAFLAGFCLPWLNTRFPQHAAWFPVLFVGFFGAFTTFSAIMLDSVRFLNAGNYGLFSLNLMLQNGFGLLCAIGGIMLSRRMLP